MFENIFQKKDEDQKNIGKITSEKAADLIKTLSGGEVKYTKKVIDNVILFTGASGGTGVSTIVANTAYISAQEGLRVLIIDLNIMYPSQHLYFNVNRKQEIEKADLFSYLIGKSPIGDSIDVCGNISVLYANNRTLMDSINCESDAVISNFQSMILKLRQLFDIILIDCPLKIEHTLCNFAFYTADSIYLVWDEGISCISNTEKIRRNMAASGIDTYTKMKVILNKRTDIPYNEYPFKKLNIELVEILPFEQDIIYSSLRSEVFCDKGASKSKNAAAFYNGMVSLTDSILKNGGYIK